MKRYFLRVMTLACLGLLNLGFAHAQNKDTADGLVKFVVEDVMNTIKNDKAIQAGDLRKINTLVDQKILPYSNFQKPTRLAMGRNWNKATPAQQEQITQEFKNLLIRIYSGALAQVRDQKIQYKPFRAAADETDVQGKLSAISITYS